MQHAVRHYLTAFIVLVGLLALGVLVFIYSGIYDIGADEPHSRPVYAAMQTLRNRSIATHADDIVVPDLNDGSRVLEGAGHYDAMCTGCHLKPGKQESEMRQGLYPKPPRLAQTHVQPSHAFWIIKHGIKMSGMPAWGKTHDDRKIWSIVAFLQRLPGLSAQQYQELVARAPKEEEGEHEHGQQGHGDQPEPGSRTAPAGGSSAGPSPVPDTHSPD